jgi:hypothetical protein
MLKSFLVSIALIFCLCSIGDCEVSPYGKRVRFTPGKSIDYPDFTIRFVGTRREVPKVYPRGWLVYDFEVVSKRGEIVKVAWSSGTGSIEPSSFSVGGKEYFLELKATVAETDSRKQWLKDDEMIIWTKEVYLKMIENPRNR